MSSEGSAEHLPNLALRKPHELRVQCWVQDDRELEVWLCGGPSGGGASTHVLGLWSTKTKSSTWSWCTCGRLVLRREAHHCGVADFQRVEVTLCFLCEEMIQPDGQTASLLAEWRRGSS